MSLLPSFSVKDLIELLKRGAMVEAQEQIMELRQAAINIQEENMGLRERVRELEGQLALGELFWDGKVYWVQDPSNSILGNSNGPFCSRCADADGKRIRLKDNRATRHRSQIPHWRCDVCNTTYLTR